jgi:hypothetical protein
VRGKRLLNDAASPNEAARECFDFGRCHVLGDVWAHDLVQRLVSNTHCAANALGLGLALLGLADGAVMPVDADGVVFNLGLA